MGSWGVGGSDLPNLLRTVLVPRSNVWNICIAFTYMFDHVIVTTLGFAVLHAGALLEIKLVVH